MPYKFPKSIGACADLLAEIRAEKSTAQKVVDELDEKRKALEEYIINTLPKTDSGASGKTHRVSVTTSTVPTVKDWGKLQTWVKKTGNFQIFQRRLNTEAIREIWEAKKPVPGVETFTVVKVSLNKL